MREIRLSGSEGGGFEYNRFPLPLSPLLGGVNPARQVPFEPHFGNRTIPGTSPKHRFLPTIIVRCFGRSSRGRRRHGRR